MNEDREIEIILDIKQVRRRKQVAKSEGGRKAYDTLEYILTSWKEQLTDVIYNNIFRS